MFIFVQRAKQLRKSEAPKEITVRPRYCHKKTLRKLAKVDTVFLAIRRILKN